MLRLQLVSMKRFAPGSRPHTKGGDGRKSRPRVRRSIYSLLKIASRIRNLILRGLLTQQNWRGVTLAKRLRAIIYQPSYAQDDDGLDELMTHECLIYAFPRKAFVDESYQSRNFRCAEVKSRDVRRKRILLAELEGTQTPLG